MRVVKALFPVQRSRDLRLLSRGWDASHPGEAQGSAGLGGRWSQVVLASNRKVGSSQPQGGPRCRYSAIMKCLDRAALDSRLCG